MATKLTVIGARPASRSLTPIAWNALFSAMGIDAEYEAWSAPTVEDFRKSMERIREDPGFIGCNVTMPWKEEAARLVDSIHGTAKDIGAVNTVRRRTDGKLSGFNTDGWGAVTALSNAGAKLKKETAVVTGAGGAAKSIVYELAKAGASVMVHNRTPGRAQELAASVNKATGTEKVLGDGLESIGESLRQAHVMIDTTPLGSHGENETEAVLDATQVKLTPKDCIFMDVVYIPRETQLLKLALKNRRPVVHGSEMLIMQAIKAFEHFFGERPGGQYVSPMRNALVEAIEEKEKAEH